MLKFEPGIKYAIKPCSMLVILAIVCNKLKPRNLVLSVEPNSVDQLGTDRSLQLWHMIVIHGLPAIGESVLGDFKGIIELLISLIEAFNRGCVNLRKRQLGFLGGLKIK